MFTKILIANRGEIACRVIRTARAMGVKTVAIYSDADANAQHVEMADEAVHIGPAPVSDSYLQMERIISAAQDTGAETIHPGYGFLSENPDFIEKVEASGLIFIGPSAKAVRAMGLKDAAKALMEKAKVPVVPGYHGEVQEPGFLSAKANEIGYPVLIKASAGGGGKGMRKVEAAKDFSAALASAKREAKSAFGEDRVLIEKYISNPRHIEVQVFGDNHGNVVHLFERDCSLQRRHQKVIEEAPAPGMTEEMRAAMTSAAVKAAKAIDYSGAGTIEFIVDGANMSPSGFWFMEMNTRLQVEHPVTELVTGIDLVEWQLRVASGEQLPRKQAEIELCGHAFEARLYAEDVPKGFLPATGTLHHLHLPDDIARIDSGVRQGDTITPHYDPMIAKIVTSGDDRNAALEHMNAALQHSRIAGTVTNLAFLEKLARNAAFAAGDVDTGLIDRNIESLSETTPQTPQHLAIAAVLLVQGRMHTAGIDPWQSLGGFTLWGNRDQFADFIMDGELQEIRVTALENAHWCCSWGDEKHEFMLRGNSQNAAQNAAQHFCSIIRDGKETHLHFAFWPERNPGHVTLFENGSAHDFEIADPLQMISDTAGSGDTIAAPMPGLVKQIGAKAGDSVSKGDPLVVLEAMKMEHSLTAPRDGEIGEILVSEGDQVEDGALLVRMKEDG